MLFIIAMCFAINDGCVNQESNEENPCENELFDEIFNAFFWLKLDLTSISLFTIFIPDAWCSNCWAVNQSNLRYRLMQVMTCLLTEFLTEAYSPITKFIPTPKKCKYTLIMFIDQWNKTKSVSPFRPFLVSKQPKT